MQTLPEIFRRNRTVIVLFTTLVILPSVFLGYLGFRAIRSSQVEQEFQQRNSQRQVVLLLESELKSWLFSERPDGAASQALLRFTVDGDRAVIPGLGESASSERTRPPVPANSFVGRELEEVYYPRIQVFVRDFNLGQNSGAQYFRRLRAMIVRVPGTTTGYVLESSKLMEFSTRKLDDLTALENYRASLLIAEAGEPALGGEEVVSLNDFTFFHVAFQPKETPVRSFRGNILLYSTILLTIITALGGFFLYRVVSYEVAVVQLRADFVSAVSHEFRTPLSSILALLERLEAGHVVDKDMLHRYHQTLRQEARRLGLLVDNLLDFAQLEAGKKKLSLQSVDLEEIINEAVSAAHRSGLGRIDRQASPDGAPAYILADRTAIIHCVQNLLENALKYSAPGTSVLIRSGLKDGVAFVEVTDQGIGIDVRDQQRIFDKFYRADNARALNVHGTGIGLALVKRIMKSHGGSVQVESTPGKGSCFRLMFSKGESES